MIGIGIYVKDSPGAVALYQQAFGLTLGYHVRSSDDTYFHAELLRNGQAFCSVVEAKESTFADRHPIELGVSFNTREDLERAFHLLSDEGRVEMDICELPWSPCAAIVIDRFSVRWFLSLPQHRPPEDWSPENETSPWSP